MKFFLDHDVPRDIGRILRLKEHEVVLLEEVLPRHSSDLTALQYATNHKLVIITCNRQDFLRLAETEPHAGMIILVRRRSRVAECAALLRLLAHTGEGGIIKNINFA